MMKAALETARKAPGVRESSGTYMVSQQQRENEPPVWVAEQQLNLTSDEGLGLLGLIGELQGSGLAIQDLTWTLSPNTRRGIERQLLSEALDALARTARTAADGLNLRVLGWRRINLTPSGPIEPPYRGRMAMSAKAETAPPVAAAGLSEVVVTVSAEALLGSGR
jgi:predicted secreted protein